MTERTPGGEEETSTQNELTNREENPTSQIAESKEKAKGHGTETITTVKSKIREKASALSQEKEASNKTSKTSNTKLAKVSRRKRGKSKSTETLETQEHVAEEEKTELPAPDTLQAESYYMDSKLDVKVSGISKKSLLQTDAKTSRRQLETNEVIQAKPSDLRNSLGEEQSTFVISHDVEPSKEETVPQNEEVTSRRSTVQRHERGNYMSNVSPIPIDEYNTDNEEDAEKK